MNDNSIRKISIAPLKTSILNQDQPDQTGVLDGSATKLNQFLCELTEMIGQSNGRQIVPVLELQFGEILTSTVLSKVKEVTYLSITAFLPRLKRSEYMPLSLAQLILSSIATDSWECLWHADDGCYMVIHKIPITEFSDERSVMDAIVDTSDLAALWFAKIDIDPSHSK